jgi:elongation factor 1 alpha-like protein
VVYSFSSKVPGKISSLEFTINKKNDEVLTKKPKKLSAGNLAQVVIKLEQRTCMELFENNRAMGRIALRDGNETIAAGTITELVS